MKAACAHNLAYNNTTTTFQTAGGSGGTQDDVNKNGDTIIAYCFAEISGYSKFSSYTGNGNADGSFIYTGFKPAFVLMKRVDSTSNWSMFDNKRTGSTKGGATIGKANPIELLIHPDLTNVTGTAAAGKDWN